MGPLTPRLLWLVAPLIPNDSSLFLLAVVTGLTFFDQTLTIYSVLVQSTAVSGENQYARKEMEILDRRVFFRVIRGGI